MYRAGAIAITILILAGCSSPTTVAPTAVPASPPVPAPALEPTPAPTPTPVPHLLLIAEAPIDWEKEAESFAQALGWDLQSVDPGLAVQRLRGVEAPAAVIGVGDGLEGELEAAAARGIPVVVVDVPDVEPGARLSTVGGTRFDQAGFLAGVMVGLSSRTGWVGLVSDTDGPNEAGYGEGFAQGMLWACPRCQVISQAAEEMSIDRFRANTVDAIFPIPGSAAAHIAESLVESDFPLVWVGFNGPPSDTLIGRIVYDEGATVLTALTELIETGEGKEWTLSIENRAIFPVNIDADRLSPGRQRLLEEAYEAIAAGELDIGTELEG